MIENKVIALFLSISITFFIIYVLSVIRILNNDKETTLRELIISSNVDNGILLFISWMMSWVSAIGWLMVLIFNLLT